MGDGFKLYIYSGAVPAIILVPTYVAVLLKARAGSKYKFVTRIVWLLLVSNLAEIVLLANTFEPYVNPIAIFLGNIVYAFSGFLRDAAFN
jgi:hypothetical protein